MKYLILHNIRSVHNVGAIFRTADALAVDKIYLTGYTPAPIDRFARVRKDFKKTSLGAEKSVVWEKCEDVLKLFDSLRHRGFEIVAVEQNKKSVDYKNYAPSSKVALIFGNEVSGLEKSILDNCDKIIEIKMRGKKESLNVSVAAGVILFRIFDR